ncbi:MAG TPA: ATP-grasp domain-containing protein [Vicinamibacterales bacterium]|nr:ATP-grasp domain-containing protein [Vicinamibacterales bacterium]
MKDVTQRPRVLLCATTTGYQTRMFDEAAARLGVELVLATDRCDRLDDPWRDRAIPVRLHDEAAALAALQGTRLDGVLAVGDRPVALAALVAEARRLPWHSVSGARASRDKRWFRARQRAAGLPAPWSTTVAAGQTLPPAGVSYPCVVKPLVLSGSRGVIRADCPEQLTTALARVSALLTAPDVRELRDDAAATIQIEEYIEGDEFALEGLMDRGRLHVLALFDKPEPLTGPYFEETVYLTPTARTDTHALAIVSEVTRAAQAVGLWHGPVHAECRVSPGGAVWVLEVAARPIGGLCARAVTFDGPNGRGVALEDVLLAHAAGLGAPHWRLARPAAGVMMVPIPRSGVLRGVAGADGASAVPGVTAVVVTAKIDQRLVALPEGASYLGFIFADGPDHTAVHAALRAAHARLVFQIDTVIDVRVAGPEAGAPTSSGAVRSRAAGPRLR